MGKQNYTLKYCKMGCHQSSQQYQTPVPGFLRQPVNFATKPTGLEDHDNVFKAIRYVLKRIEVLRASLIDAKQMVIHLTSCDTLSKNHFEAALRLMLFSLAAEHRGQLHRKAIVDLQPSRRSLNIEMSKHLSMELQDLLFVHSVYDQIMHRQIDDIEKLTASLEQLNDDMTVLAKKIHLESKNLKLSGKAAKDLKKSVTYNVKLFRAGFRTLKELKVVFFKEQEEYVKILWKLKSDMGFIDAIGVEASEKNVFTPQDIANQLHTPDRPILDGMRFGRYKSKAPTLLKKMPTVVNSDEDLRQKRNDLLVKIPSLMSDTDTATNKRVLQSSSEEHRDGQLHSVKTRSI
eukprot:TRINITY_DN20901_c0_g1_i1.p1 TRINITY_DN20901_c0_g1~~TRINITY_DN20901_c0_g1_i1.p1  ORF type:complete len:346 (+),score=46.12 TRINITY_DN20901_c0_g1_i1:3-1040(+)